MTLAIFSEHARRVQLRLFDSASDTGEKVRVMLGKQTDQIRLRSYDRILLLNPRQLQLLLAHDVDRLARDVARDSPELTEFQSVLFHPEHRPVYTDTDPAHMVGRRREKDVAIARLAAAVEQWPAIGRHGSRHVPGWPVRRRGDGLSPSWRFATTRPER